MEAEQRPDTAAEVAPLGRYLAARAADGDAPALICSDATWTWTDVAARSAAAGRALLGTGLSPGERVAFVIDPAPSAVTCIALAAAASVGVVVVPVNARFSRSERDAVLAAAAPAGVLDDATLHALVTASGRSHTVGAVAPPAAPVHDVAVDDDVVVVCSSGTTGAAKGIRCTHRNAVVSAEAVNRALRITAQDRWLLSLPMVHVGALSVWWRALRSGCAVVLSDPAAPDLDAAAPTVASLVPTQLQRLVRSGAPVPASLRCVLLGGGAVGDGLYADAVTAGWPVRPSYGLSEMCSTVAVAPPPGPGAVSVPSARLLDGVSCVVVGGHVLVDGPMRSPGRAWGPAAVETVVDGRRYLDTFDVGVLDADGGLRISGRADAMFVVGGENVHPEEVETALLRHPDVTAALVTAVPDDEKGHVATAEVVAADPSSPPDPVALRAHCRLHLAAYKVPVRFSFVDDLPRTATGKVRRS